MTGNPGTGWGAAEIARWRDDVIRAGKVRDYAALVQAIHAAADAAGFAVAPYARDTVGRPLLQMRSQPSEAGNPVLLITAGVHGYEPSGPAAAISFVAQHARHWSDRFAFVVYPCISPWAFEYDQRWNHDALDPNRMFRADDLRVAECATLMQALSALDLRFAGAIDLHETRDIDIALNALRDERFGKAPAVAYDSIPNGTYVIVSRTGEAAADARQAAFGRAVVDAIRPQAPIASDPILLGSAQNMTGVAAMAPTVGTLRALLGQYAAHVAVTEIYADDRTLTPQKCIDAQICAIDGALGFLARAAGGASS